MTTETRPGTLGETLCSVRAIGLGEDPIGYGSPTTRMLAIEMPTPWGEGFYEADPQGTVQQRLWAERIAYFDRIRESGNAEQVFARGYASFYGIAPDREWSDPSIRRVLLIDRPEGEPTARFGIREFHFPFDSMRVVDMARAVFDDPADIEAFGDVEVEHGGYREFFVCTHGSVDICCAKFGVPLYMEARRRYPGVRAWRMTHFGGHRFAPTAWEFPDGYKWAFLDGESARHVLDRDVPTEELLLKVRGWSGVPNRVSLLDRVGLEEFGWAWLDYRRSGDILEEDAEARRWRVRLDFESPSGERGAYEGVVVVGRDLVESGCGPHFGEANHEVAEYQLESLTRLPV